MAGSAQQTWNHIFSDGWSRFYETFSFYHGLLLVKPDWLTKVNHRSYASYSLRNIRRHVSTGHHRAVFWNHGRSEKSLIASLRAALAWTLKSSYADPMLMVLCVCVCGVCGVFAFKPHQWQSKPSRSVKPFSLGDCNRSKFMCITFCMSYKCLVQFWKVLLFCYPAVQINCASKWNIPSITFQFTKRVSVSLQVAFCGELGGGDLADLFRTDLHKVTKHWKMLKDVERCWKMLKDIDWEMLKGCKNVQKSDQVWLASDSGLLHHCGEPSQVLERVVGHKVLPHTECLHSECFRWAVSMHSFP